MDQLLADAEDADEEGDSVAAAELRGRAADLQVRRSGGHALARLFGHLFGHSFGHLLLRSPLGSEALTEQPGSSYFIRFYLIRSYKESITDL